MFFLIRKIAYNREGRMLKLRLLSIRNELLTENLQARHVFLWKTQIQQLQPGEDEDHFPFDFHHSYYLSQLSLLRHCSSRIYLLGRFPATFDPKHSPSQPPIHQQYVTIINHRILLGKGLGQPPHLIPKHHPLLTFDLKLVPPISDDVDMILIIRQVGNHPLCQSNDPPHLLSYIINIAFKNKMSFDFDFDVPNADNRNLEEIMQKVNQSFKFDQFDPVDNQPLQTSNDFFSRGSKKEEKKDSKKLESAKSRQESREQDFENSRNINEISLIGFEKNTSFQVQPPSNYPVASDARYENLQKLLGKAKTNSLDHFYRNLDQQNSYPNENKFRDKDQFNRYRSQLKSYKKNLEQNFQTKNGNYNFRENGYQRQLQALSNEYNFKRKEQIQDFNFFQQDPNTNNFLPAGLRDFEQDADFPEISEEQLRKQQQKYKEQQYRKQVGEFFSSSDQLLLKKKQEKPTKKLQTINEQRANIFQNTQEQQKMGKILNNYQQLKLNYNGIMQRMKETNSDKVLILSELKKLKDECENRESRMKLQEENKREKQLARQREKEDQGRKLMAMREEIHRMKDNTEKDVLILKLNEKVESLEGMLRNAINQLTEEKEPKLIPKIINYYPEPASARSHQTSYSGDEQQQPSRSQQPSRIDENALGPVRNAIRELRQQRREQPPSHFIDEFSSPLQLDLTVQDYPLNLSRGGRSQQLQQPFVPAQNSKQFIPTGMDSNNKFLRRCLTQKSAVMFQSFQFYVTGKYSVTGNDRYPVTCEVRVANKCAINLYDVYVIVYGPQAQEAELEVRPAKNMYDQFKYNTSFLFQVDLSRSCLEAGSFSIQLSYKTDKKKKVNFKATIPFAQLIKPEFIYQQQFITAWNHMDNELYVRPRAMDCRNIRSHQDLKLILPFTEINQPDPNCFSYGIMFTYPKSATLYMVKVTCYISGKASLHLKSSQAGQGADKRLREQVLQILNYLIFG